MIWICNYHPFKANVVEDALRRLSISYVARDKEESKELVNDVHKLTRLGVRLISIVHGGEIVLNGLESLLIVDAKEKQDGDPILL